MEQHKAEEDVQEKALTLEC